MEGSADADQRHRIIITMMNLEEKTDTRMSWCATSNDVKVRKARGECTWKCGEPGHFQINCWLRPSSLSQV